MFKLISIRHIFLGLIIISTTACAGKSTEDVNSIPELVLTFTMDSDVNPDDNKQPSPLIIRMYELKDTKNFKKINFIDMFERDTDMISDQLVDKQRLRHVEPGEVREIKFVLNKKTKYVGLFAEFLQYKNSKYKLVFPITQNNVGVTSVKIQISGNRMILVK